jgi:hypothetical protein
VTHGAHDKNFFLHVAHLRPSGCGTMPRLPTAQHLHDFWLFSFSSPPCPPYIERSSFTVCYHCQPIGVFVSCKQAIECRFSSCTINHTPVCGSGVLPFGTSTRAAVLFGTVNSGAHGYREPVQSPRAIRSQRFVDTSHGRRDQLRQDSLDLTPNGAHKAPAGLHSPQGGSVPYFPHRA